VVHQVRGNFNLLSETKPASETSCFFKKKIRQWTKPPLLPTRKILSVDFSHALLSFLDFEDVIDRLSEKVVKELPFYTA